MYSLPNQAILIHRAPVTETSFLDINNLNNVHSRWQVSPTRKSQPHHVRRNLLQLQEELSTRIRECCPGGIMKQDIHVKED